jgi:uncharacterized protein involved in response to NO
LVALLLWVGVLTGALACPPGGMLAWHRHEMLYGFAAAIIAGFLLTAVQNWSGIPGLSGRALQVCSCFGCWAALVPAVTGWLAGADRRQLPSAGGA